MVKDSLENNSLWYNYKTEVWNQKTPEAAAVHNIMRVVRSIRTNELAYASAPVTTGKIFYHQMLSNPRMEKNDLLSWAINENYREGSLFVDKLCSRLDIPVIFPSELVPARQKWGQSHFQALWLSVIAEKCTELHMMDDWQYSNGAAEEFTYAMQLRLGLPKSSDLFFFNTKGKESDERKRMKNIKVYAESGKELTIDDGIEYIARSREWLKSVKLNSAKLDNCYNLLNWTKGKIKEGFYQ